MTDAPPPQIARPTPLDAVDLVLLAELESNARLTNAALAARAGIAESTCTQRLRALRAGGAIRRFRADVDPAALGLTMQAVIKVRLASHSRDQVHAFRELLPSIPNVLTIFHLAGADDYLLHVALEDSDALRDFVVNHLTTHPAVGHTETSLIFGHLRGSAVTD